MATIGDAIAAARPAYDDLTALAEDVEDEWSYINDLAAAWIERMDARCPPPAGTSRRQPASRRPPGAHRRGRLLDDPHRAIDWLSTFPQVLLIALGERP